MTNTVQQRKSVLLLYSEQINNAQYTEMCVCVLVALVQIQNISGCGCIRRLLKLGWSQPIFRPSLRSTDSREGPTRAFPVSLCLRASDLEVSHAILRGLSVPEVGDGRLAVGSVIRRGTGVPSVDVFSPVMFKRGIRHSGRTMILFCIRTLF